MLHRKVDIQLQKNTLKLICSIIILLLLHRNRKNGVSTIEYLHGIPRNRGRSSFDKRFHISAIDASCIHKNLIPFSHANERLYSMMFK